MGRGKRLEDPALAAEAARLARGVTALRTVVLAATFVVFGVFLLVLATTPDLRSHGWS